MRKKLQWIIPIITYFIAIVLVIIALCNRTVLIDNLLAALIVPLFSFLFPIISTIIKRDIPLWLNILVCIEMLLCVVGGNVYNIYQDLQFYDVFLHIYFGFSCSAIFYYFIIHFQNGVKINRLVLYFLLFLSVLGMSAIWEFWEYACDLVTGGDGQMVNEAILQGKSPVSDTMEDMLVTIIGILGFYLLIVLDNKFIKKIFVNFKRSNDGSEGISKISNENS